MDLEDISQLMKKILFEFPVSKLTLKRRAGLTLELSSQKKSNLRRKS